MHVRVAPRARVVACVDETPEERSARLEALGRAEAERLKALDSTPIDDGGLAAAFQERLDAEGGAQMFKLKSNANQLGDSAKDAARQAQSAAADVGDSARGLVSGLTEQQKNVAKIIGGLIAFQLLIGFIGSLFSGGGSGGYSV